MLKEKYKTEIDDILSRYPVRRSAVLPLLYMAQKEEGYVSEAAMKEIAGILRLTQSQVYEVVTFYTMFQCALVGSDTLLAWLKVRLGIGPGETTIDKLFTISTVECLASCGTGPMMQINDDYYESVTEDKLDRILADLKQNGTSLLKSGPFMLPEADIVKR
jgi:NADH-quinone oxidoreductase subunit E